MAEPEDDDLPIATPIPPPLTEELVKPVRKGVPVEPKPRRRDVRMADHEADHKPPRARTFAACGIVGCLAIAVLAAVGFVAFAAIMLLGQLGNEITERTNEPTPQTKTSQLTRPGPIQLTKLGKDSENIILPGPVTAVCRSANGRFLLMQVKTQTLNQILVFDPNEGRLLEPFSFDAGDAPPLFAAGTTTLFIYNKAQLARYNLVTREPIDPVVPITPWDVQAIGAGMDDNLCLVRQVATPPSTKVSFFNTATLADESSVIIPNRGRIGRNVPRFSASGRVIGIGPDLTGKGQFVTSAANNVVYRQLIVADTPGHITPSPNGEWLYTNRGVFKPDGKQVLKPSGRYLYTLPTAHGNDFFLSLNVGLNGNTGSTVNLHKAGATDPGVVVKLSNVIGPAGLPADDPPDSPVAADQRVHFWPAAGLVAVLPQVNPFGQHTLQLYKVNDSPLTGEHLYIVSDPPVFAVRGETWTYLLNPWSSSDIVEFKLKSGPTGMKVTSNHESSQATWSVPLTFTPDEQTVVIEASAGGQTTEQKFRLVILDPNKP